MKLCHTRNVSKRNPKVFEHFKIADHQQTD